MTQTPKRTNRFTLFYLSVLSAYFHVFMEWIFFVTKPSSLSILSFYEKLNVLIVSGGIFALVLLGILLVLSVPVWLANAPEWKSRFTALSRVPQLAFIVAVLALVQAARRVPTPTAPHASRWAAALPPYAIGSVAMYWVVQRIATF